MGDIKAQNYDIRAEMGDVIPENIDLSPENNDLRSEMSEFSPAMGDCSGGLMVRPIFQKGLTGTSEFARLQCMYIRDGGYKRLFSNKTIFRLSQFIKGIKEYYAFIYNIRCSKRFAIVPAASSGPTAPNFGTGVTRNECG